MSANGGGGSTVELDESEVVNAESSRAYTDEIIAAAPPSDFLDTTTAGGGSADAGTTAGTTVGGDSTLAKSVPASHANAAVDGTDANAVNGMEYETTLLDKIDELHDSNQENGGAVPLRETGEHEAEEFTRAKSAKQGPFIVIYTDKSAPEDVIKFKKAKSSSAWLLEIISSAPEGSFDLVVSKPEEAAKITALNVSMQITSLDVFTIVRGDSASSGTMAGSGSGSRNGSPKSSGGKRSFLRSWSSKSNKSTDDATFSYFLPAIRGYQRHQDAKIGVGRLPPIQFTLPPRVYSNMTGTTTLTFHWKAVDDVAREKNNRRRMQFLYPPIPSY